MSTIIISLQQPGSTAWRDCVLDSTCVSCGDRHDKLWTVSRRVEPWGHFGVAAINEREANGRFAHKVVIDSSLPTVVATLPKDAVEVDRDTAARWWHDDNESHVFGGPNVAKALRESIAAHNAAVSRG